MTNIIQNHVLETSSMFNTWPKSSGLSLSLCLSSANKMNFAQGGGEHGSRLYIYCILTTEFISVVSCQPLGWCWLPAYPWNRRWWVTLALQSSLTCEYHALLFVDNVHFQNTAQLVEALTEANVLFDMQVIYYWVRTPPLLLMFESYILIIRPTFHKKGSDQTGHLIHVEECITCTCACMPWAQAASQ